MDSAGVIGLGQKLGLSLLLGSVAAVYIALTAVSATSFSHDSVFCGELMAMLAMGFHRIVVSAYIDVLARRDGLKMFRVDAGRILAGMMQIMSVWDRSNQDKICCPMSWYEISVEQHVCIARRHSVTSPIPTARGHDSDLQRQANDRRHSLNGFHTYSSCKECA